MQKKKKKKKKKKEYYYNICYISYNYLILKYGEKKDSKNNIPL